MLPDCAKVTVDEDGDLCSCVTWNGGICDILFNSSSSISTLLKPGRTYPYDVWVIWANWPIWEVLLYNFRNLFLVVQPPHSFKRSSYLPFFVLLPLVPWSLSLSLCHQNDLYDQNLLWHHHNGLMQNLLWHN